MSRIGIEVTGVLVSKKGTVWIQAKVVHPNAAATTPGILPATGEIYMCEYDGKVEPKKTKSEEVSHES